MWFGIVSDPRRVRRQEIVTAYEEGRVIKQLRIQTREYIDIIA